MSPTADRARPPALRRLADAVGIVPWYLDQTGRERRETSEESMVAILGALGIDASTEARAAGALEQMQIEARGEVLPPVRVMERADGPLEVEARLPRGTQRWRAQLTDESGEVQAAEGTGAEPVVLPRMPGLGYHSLALTVTRRAGETRHEQTLIVVPPHCTLPDELLGTDRVWGVIANLYTVHSATNWGFGDFSDLGRLGAWAGAQGGDFVGMNPLHALLNRESQISPYSPVSRLFRNPLYIDVAAVPELAQAEAMRRELGGITHQAALAELRSSDAVDYDRVAELKAVALRELHAVFTTRDLTGERHAAYRAFIDAREPELTGFAIWMAIAEHLRGSGDRGWTDWRTWPAELRDPASAGVRQFAREHEPDVDFQRWLQFETARQLGEAGKTMRAAGMRIGVYQDLAIGTAPGGSDTWSMPELFVRGVSVGAPPDPYAMQGQNWGLPPMDPRVLRRDRYHYWVRLLRSAFEGSGALRIDHVMGLFRLFWIPDGMTGAQGAYMRYPAQDMLGILALESVRHRALVVGEDLGTVPKDVPPALQKWGILSSKVLYFERQRRGAFKPAADYAPLSLATANTHDMATLTGFWRERDLDIRGKVGLIAEDAMLGERETRRRDKKLLLQRLKAEGILPRAVAPKREADLRAAVHSFLCRSPARLVGLSLDDLAGEAEPVNVPGVGPETFPCWSRRMRMPIEDITRNDDVRAALRCEGRGRGAQ